MSGLKLEIVQERPFSSAEEEALLNLMRTPTPYNGLSIAKFTNGVSLQRNTTCSAFLRGAQPRGLTCAAIGSRMITAEPDITRLLAGSRR